MKGIQIFQMSLWNNLLLIEPIISVEFFFPSKLFTFNWIAQERQRRLTLTGQLCTKDVIATTIVYFIFLFPRAFIDSLHLFNSW